ncbi:MAG: TldD protein [Lysobacteraceae bacterium]|nr:MAG: TldD protein [Xanthomonadaceae bacterium]
MIMTKEQAKAILDKALSYSESDECEVNLNGSITGNVRYALNTVTTAGVTEDTTLVVQSAYGKKTGTATLNQFDDESIKRAVRTSEELARLSPESEEYMPILGPQEYVEGKGFVQATADMTPEMRAQAAANSIVPSREKGLTAAGFLNDNISFQAMANSKGLFAYYPSTGVSFSTTIRTADGTGSGWASRDYNDVSKLDTAKASQIAIDKSIMSQEARAIEPGKYTVVLEPAASVTLIGNMLGAFNRRTADEGRSFMAKEGGGNKLGEKLFDERVSIHSDPQDPDAPYSPWAQDGQAFKRTQWVENGVVKNMGCSRYWAGQHDLTPVPAPNSFTMAGGESSLEELIKGVRRGILVTRTWYIRTVDPQTQLYTGLTRDGTFFIEDGELKYPVKNLRFNESPVIMLNNLEKLGQAQRINGNMVPSMVIRDFTFSSLSDAV